MRPAQLSRTWAAHEMAVLEQAVASGRPLQDVAEELGRSLNAVQIRRNRHFPTPKPEPGMNHGWSPGLGRIEKYWTSERVIAGLRYFASQRPGLLPNSDHDYSAAKKGHMEWPTAASPKRTYRKRPADIGDYDRRYGLRRVSINGRIVRVAV